MADEYGLIVKRGKGHIGYSTELTCNGRKVDFPDSGDLRDLLDEHRLNLIRKLNGTSAGNKLEIKFSLDSK